MYHSVGNSDLFGNVSVNRFQRDIAAIDRKYDIVSLSKILEGGNEDSEQIALTFDDGFRNFYTDVYPVLDEFDVPATVFVSSTFIGDQNLERIRDRLAVSADVSEVIMTESQIQELLATDLVTLGNHTRTHPRLATITDQGVLRSEIHDAQTDLQERFDAPVDFFAYPHGSYTEDVVEVVREFHDAAVSTRHGLFRGDLDRYDLPRIHAHTPRYQFEWDLTELSESLRRRYYSSQRRRE